MKSSNSQNRIVSLFAVLATTIGVTTSLLSALAAHAWLPAPPTTDVSGAIISDTTWMLADSPFVLTGNVIVTAGVTLTIEPGVMVMGQSNTALGVAGHLEAAGTATQPITFTSAANTGAGEWRGISFGGGTGNLAHIVVQYAGQGGSSGIDITGSPTDGPVTIVDSVLRNNLGYPLKIRPEDLHRLQMSNVSFADNGSNRIVVSGQQWSNVTLTENVTLSGQPGLEGYEIVDFVIIVPAGITMTLQPGTTIMATDSGYCPISVAENGHLEAVGTAVCTDFHNNSGDAVYVAGSGAPDVLVFSSSLSGNGGGVNNGGGTAVDARQNWWGDSSGPGGNGPGSGDAVWGNVLYDPWLNEPTCTLIPYQLFLPVVIGP